MTPDAAADLLRDARTSRRTIEPFSDARPELDEAWGYAVQDVDRTHREAAGEQVVGAKLGLTSVAKQRRMGLDRPIVGFLTDAMPVAATEVRAALARWHQPRIEPEVLLVTARPIGTALGDDEVAAHVAGVGLAAEVIDSRYTGYRFRLPDVLADDTSAAGVVLGDDVVPLAAIGGPAALAELRCEVAVDGDVVHEATGAAILGQPLRALQLLSAHLERRAEVLPAGSLVLAGALTDAVPLVATSSYRLTLERLGTITV